MFWNPEVITTTGKSLRITQIRFNIIYLIRTVIRYSEKQPESHRESSPELCKSSISNCRLPGNSPPLVSQRIIPETDNKFVHDILSVINSINMPYHCRTTHALRRSSR